MLSLPQNCSPSAQKAQSRVVEAARSAGRSVDSVTLLAVSKGQSSAAIDSAANAGLEHFGENFVQETLPKMQELTGRELTWHFIGRLQANKTRAVADNFAWVHTIDRLKIAERLSSQRPYHAPALNVCLQLRRWRGQQGRREASGYASSQQCGPADCGCAVSCTCRRPKAVARQRGGSRNTPGVYSERTEPWAGYLVHGHQRGLQAGDCRSATWCASAPPSSARAIHLPDRR